MRRAFVTGASGFLGINLVEALLKEQWEVIALVLPEDSKMYLKDKNITCVVGDILDKTSLRNVIPQGDSVTVFHVAGMTSMWDKERNIQYQINVTGTKNVCEIAIEKQVRKLVYTSSISAYGHHKSRVSEQTVSNALNCGMNYNRTKYLSEREIHKAIGQGLDAVILNPCNIIGPYDMKGWSTLIKSVNEGNPRGATDGTGTFTHVHDVVDAHIIAADKGVVGDNYLLGGVEVTFKEVIEAICKMLKKKPPRKSASPLVLLIYMKLLSIKSLFDKKMPILTYPRYKRLTGYIVCDDLKARTVLGYKTRTLEEMLKDSYNWLKKEDLL